MTPNRFSAEDWAEIELVKAKGAKLARELAEHPKRYAEDVAYRAQYDRECKEASARIKKMGNQLGNSRWAPANMKDNRTPGPVAKLVYQPVEEPAAVMADSPTVSATSSPKSSLRGNAPIFKFPNKSTLSQMDGNRSPPAPAALKNNGLMGSKWNPANTTTTSISHSRSMAQPARAITSGSSAPLRGSAPVFNAPSTTVTSSGQMAEKSSTCLLPHERIPKKSNAHSAPLIKAATQRAESVEVPAPVQKKSKEEPKFASLEEYRAYLNTQDLGAGMRAFQAYFDTELKSQNTTEESQQAPRIKSAVSAIPSHLYGQVATKSLNCQTPASAMGQRTLQPSAWTPPHLRSKPEHVTAFVSQSSQLATNSTASHPRKQSTTQTEIHNTATQPGTTSNVQLQGSVPHIGGPNHTTQDPVLSSALNASTPDMSSSVPHASAPAAQNSITVANPVNPQYSINSTARARVNVRKCDGMNFFTNGPEVPDREPTTYTPRTPISEIVVLALNGSTSTIQPIEPSVSELKQPKRVSHLSLTPTTSYNIIASSVVQNPAVINQSPSVSGDSSSYIRRKRIHEMSPPEYKVYCESQLHLSLKANVAQETTDTKMKVDKVEAASDPLAENSPGADSLFLQTYIRPALPPHAWSLIDVENLKRYNRLTALQKSTPNINDPHLKIKDILVSAAVPVATNPVKTSPSSTPPRRTPGLASPEEFMAAREKHGGSLIAHKNGPRKALSPKAGAPNPRKSNSPPAKVRRPPHTVDAFKNPNWSLAGVSPDAFMNHVNAQAPNPKGKTYTGNAKDQPQEPKDMMSERREGTKVWVDTIVTGKPTTTSTSFPKKENTNPHGSNGPAIKQEEASQLPARKMPLAALDANKQLSPAKCVPMTRDSLFTDCALAKAMILDDLKTKDIVESSNIPLTTHILAQTTGQAPCGRSEGNSFEDKISDEGVPKGNVRATQGRDPAEQLLDFDGRWNPPPCDWDTRGTFNNSYVPSYIKEWSGAVPIPSKVIDTSAPEFRMGTHPVAEENFVDPPVHTETFPATELESDDKRVTQTAVMESELFASALKTRRADERQVAQINAQRRKELSEQISEPNLFAPNIDMYLRPATAKDTAGIAKVYNYYVNYSIIPEDQEDVTERDIGFLLQGCEVNKLPFIVAVGGSCPPTTDAQGRKLKKAAMPQFENIIGFAFAQVHAFGFGASNSFNGRSRTNANLHLYVQHALKKQGIGRNLLDRLLLSMNSAYSFHDAASWINPKQDKRYIPSSIDRWHQLFFQLPVDQKDDPEFIRTREFLAKFFFFDTPDSRLIGAGRTSKKHGAARFVDVVTFKGTCLQADVFGPFI